MDDRQLQELFQNAASAPPPATFDEHDISQGARRVTARRRMTLAGGSVAAAAVLVAGIGIGTSTVTTGGTHTQAAPPSASKPRTGETKTPSVMSLPDTGAGCGTPDPALASALATQLPEVGPTAPMAADSCPPGSNTASYVLPGGRLTAIVSPAGSVPPDLMRPGESQRPDGTKEFMTSARSGKVLKVSSHPNGAAPAPHGDQLRTIAETLASRF